MLVGWRKERRERRRGEAWEELKGRMENQVTGGRLVALSTSRRKEGWGKFYLTCHWWWWCD